jgi:hypothetical protein
VSVSSVQAVSVVVLEVLERACALCCGELSALPHLSSAVLLPFASAPDSRPSPCLVLASLHRRGEACGALLIAGHVFFVSLLLPNFGSFNCLLLFFNFSVPEEFCRHSMERLTQE